MHSWCTAQLHFRKVAVMNFQLPGITDYGKSTYCQSVYQERCEKQQHEVVVLIRGKSGHVCLQGSDLHFTEGGMVVQNTSAKKLTIVVALPAGARLLVATLVTKLNVLLFSILIDLVCFTQQKLVR